MKRQCRRNGSTPWKHPHFKPRIMGGMPYSKNPYLPKLRAHAVRLVRQGRWSIRKVARYIGVQPSTVWKWVQKTPRWEERRDIPTLSSRPHHSPNAISQMIVDRIVAIRKEHGRCAEVIHAQLAREGIRVHLNTVKRTLDRKGLLKKRSIWKKLHISGERPIPESPGILVQTDTIHIQVREKKRMYIYTLIDCNSRWAYAKASKKLSAGSALRFVQEAQQKAPFRFTCVQSDHGPEFSAHFTIFMQAKGTRHRHSRVRKPNDNAHVERFNRTIQEEMRTEIIKYKTNIPRLNGEIMKYLRYYNQERLHMGIGFKTPYEVLPRS